MLNCPALNETTIANPSGISHVIIPIRFVNPNADPNDELNSVEKYVVGEFPVNNRMIHPINRPVAIAESDHTNLLGFLTLSVDLSLVLSENSFTLSLINPRNTFLNKP